MIETPICWTWPLPEVPATSERGVLAWQAGRCGMCGVPCTGRGAHRDHDHDTGVLRGLLCRSCNLHEGHCRKPECRCARWRERNPASMLGVAVQFKGTDNSWAGYYRRKGIEPPDPREASRRVVSVLGALLDDGLPDWDEDDVE